MLGTYPSYRALLAVDIERSAGRGDPAMLDNRRMLRDTLRKVLAEAGIGWDDCHRSGTGDGLQFAFGRDTRKALLIDPVVPELAARLRAHNRQAGPLRTIRVRMALHAGDVHIDDGEVAGGSLEDLNRLLDAPPLKTSLGDAPDAATVAVAVSEHFFREVVRHDYPGIDPAAYRRFRFTVKETTTTAWLHVPGYVLPPSVADVDDPGPAPAGTTRPERAAISGGVVNIAQDNAHVGEQIGHIGTRIDHVTGSVQLGTAAASPDDLRSQLADLRRALTEHQAAGRLDSDTYEAATDELRAADSYLSASTSDQSARGRFILALRRLKGLVEGVTDLAAKVAAVINAARGH